MQVSRLYRVLRRISLAILRRLHPQVVLSVGNEQIALDLRDQVIGSILYMAGQYETELQRVMRAIDLNGSVCLDIGANIGLHTILMSRQAGTSGSVFAFEPEAHNFLLLTRNVALNKATNVFLSRCAIGEKEGTCSLVLHPTNYGDHRISDVLAFATNVQDVPITTVDAALMDIPEGRVRLVKIDVQGYELKVLRGMKTTLCRNPDAIMMIEVFPEGLKAAGTSASELVENLRSLGLSGWELHDHRIIPLSDPCAYDLIRDGKYVDLVVSRNSSLLREVFAKLYGSVGRQSVGT
jgi:FkbM family methyltransferase